MILLSEITKDHDYDFEIHELYKLLPAERKNRVNRYHKVKDQIQSILSYSLLMYGCVIRNQFRPSDIEFVFNEGKKPYCRSHNFVEFNISHCDLGVAVALSNYSIGIDIQDIYQDFETILSVAFSKFEIDDINTSGEKNKIACKYWALKESFLKFLGCGLTDNIDQIDFSGTENDFIRFGCQFKVFEKSEYVLSVCSSGIIENEPIFVPIPKILEILRRRVHGNSTRHYY